MTSTSPGHAPAAPPTAAPRRTVRLCWFTVVLLVLMGMVVGWANVHTRIVESGNSLQFKVESYRGFPVWVQAWPENLQWTVSAYGQAGRKSMLVERDLGMRLFPADPVQPDFNLVGLAVDLVFCFLVLVGTAVSSEAIGRNLPRLIQQLRPRAKRHPADAALDGEPATLGWDEVKKR